MSIAFQAAGTAVSGTAASQLVTFPGSASRQLLLVEFGFENVLASSGPWVIEGNPAHSPAEMCAGNGWERICYKPPSADGGDGLELWGAFWTSGTQGTAIFDTTRTFVARSVVYTGQYDPGTTQPLPVSAGVVRAHTEAQVTGDNPAAPSVYAFINELVIACASSQVNASGYTAPSGFTQRIDSARASTHGNVEIALVDELISVEGNTGAITWTATASPAGTKGATATLAVRPTVTTPPATAPAISVIFPTT